jgi:hypothetical protein
VALASKLSTPIKAQQQKLSNKAETTKPTTSTATAKATRNDVNKYIKNLFALAS